MRQDSGNALQVRTGLERDVPSILRLMWGLAEYELLADRVFVNEHELREALFGTKAAAEVIVCETGGRLVSFALFCFTFASFRGRRRLFLEDLYVEPAVRGRGIGRAMMCHLARIAVERKCEAVEWKVLSWNELAHTFYRSLDAVRESGLVGYRLCDSALIDLAGGSWRSVQRITDSER